MISHYVYQLGNRDMIKVCAGGSDRELVERYLENELGYKPDHVRTFYNTPPKGWGSFTDITTDIQKWKASMLAQDRKVLFTSHIERLVDEPYKEIASRLIMGLPDLFFSAPASSSGQHHPGFALGDGGLLRHTIVAVHMARDLCNQFDCKDEFSLAVVTVATAIHDGLKGAQDSENMERWTKTDMEHPRYIAEYVDGYDMTYCDDRQKTFLFEVESAAKYHMSLWGPDYLKCPVGSMPSKYEQIVALADYMSSRKYIDLDEEHELYEIVKSFR